MALQYYQQSAPGWGTSQFALGTPPPLGYAPSNSWNGLDYYRAHVNARGAHYDPAFYQNAVSRATVGGAMGSGLYEAEHWHRRAFGGTGELSWMLPAEIGAAAAYEAWRQFRHNLSQYDYLGPFDQRREALSALSVAEAMRLWQDTGRGFDQRGAAAAAEAAAATSSMILNQTQDGDGGYANAIQPDAYYRGRRPAGMGYEYADTGMRGRAISRSPVPGVAYPGSSSYAGSAPGMGVGGFATRSYDDGDAYMLGRSRARSRSRSPLPGILPPTYVGTSMGVSPVGVLTPALSSAIPYSASTTYPTGSYPYAGSYQVSSQPGATGAPVVFPDGTVYPTATAPATAMYAAGYSAPYAQAAQPTVIIDTSRRRHSRHRTHSAFGRHHHHHHGYAY